MTHRTTSKPLLVLFFSMFAAMVEAEEVRVLSGEHSDFSRIVLIFSTDIEWTENGTENGFEVSFDRSGLEMDLTDVYTKIPRSRFSSVEFDPSSSVFRIRSGCDCDLDIFEVRQGVLAMDMRFSDVEAEEELLSLGNVINEGETNTLNLTQQIDGRPSRALLPGVWPLLPNQQEKPSVEAFRSLLLTQLNAAANSGIATRDSSEKILSPKPSTSNSNTQVGAAQPNYRHPQVKVSDAFSPDPSTLDAAVQKMQDLCEGLELDAMNFGPVDDPLLTLIEARTAIVDADGEISPEGINHLFQTYVMLGQSIEARRLLMTWPQAFQNIESLEALLSVLNGSASVFLAERVGCGEAAIFWGLLASDEERRLSVDEQMAIDRYFKGLSPFLQLMLKDELASKLAKRGAIQTVAAIDRQADLSSHALGESSEGNHVIPKTSTLAMAANTVLGETGEVRDRIPASISEALRKQLMGQSGIDPSLIELAQGLSIETRGLETSTELSSVSIIALLRNGEFDSAYEQYSKLQSEISENDSLSLRLEMSGEVLRTPDDALFLSVVFMRQPWSWLTVSDRDLSDRMAKRILELGISRDAIEGLGFQIDSDSATPPREDEQTVESSPSSPDNSIDDTNREVAANAPANEATLPSENASLPLGLEASSIEPSIVSAQDGSNSLVPSLGDAAQSELAAGLSVSEALLESSRDSRSRIAEILAGQGL